MMKFKEITFDTVAERTGFLNIFFPDREKIEGNAYQIVEHGVVIIDGKKLLFLVSEEE